MNFNWSLIVSASVLVKSTTLGWPTPYKQLFSKGKENAAFSWSLAKPSPFQINLNWTECNSKNRVRIFSVSTTP